MMNVSKVLTKFIVSQHLYRGLVITTGVLLPCIFLYHYGLYGEMIALPTGTVMVSLTDHPGPRKRRLNTLLISIGIYLFIAITTNYLRHFTGIIFILLIIYGLFFSLIGVFGSRASLVGTSALIIFAFNLDDHLSQGQYLLSASYFFLGGLWYLVIFFVQDWLKPYLVIQQLMSEYLYEIGNFLSLKSQFYHHNPDTQSINKKMFASQTLIRRQQDELREILFKTRIMVRDSTQKGRSLMVIFLDSIDLSERIMITQYDYSYLPKVMENNDNRIIAFFGNYIARLSHEIEKLALSIPLQRTISENKDLLESYQKCENLFFKFRREKLDTSNINEFILLRKILHSMQDLTNRIIIMQNATNFNFANKQNDNRITENIHKFIPAYNYSWELLKDSISLKSSHFRHAIRVTVALLVGYTTALFFPVGHVYWLLMTIVMLLKPAYSLSRQLNIYRFIGTLLGIGFSFGLIHFVHNKTSLFFSVTFFMVLGYSMLKINYLIATFSITVFVVVSFASFSTTNVEGMMLDRTLDTILACLITWLTSYFVLPVWEKSNISFFIKNALKSNLNYFENTAEIMISYQYNDENFRLARKNAFIQLGNISDHFQRMMTEPKKKQHKLEVLNSFVNMTHLLTSYIASFSYYSHEYHIEPNTIRDSLTQIKQDFEKSINLLTTHDDQYHIKDLTLLPINIELQELLAQRKDEVKNNGIKTQTTIIGQKLSDLKALDSLLELINSNLYNQNLIIYKLIKN